MTAGSAIHKLIDVGCFALQRELVCPLLGHNKNHHVDYELEDMEFQALIRHVN